MLPPTKGLHQRRCDSFYDTEHHHLDLLRATYSPPQSATLVLHQKESTSMIFPKWLLYSALLITVSADDTPTAEDFAPCPVFPVDVWNDYTKATCQATVMCYSTDDAVSYQAKIDCQDVQPEYKARAVLNEQYWFNEHSDWLEGPGTITTDIDMNNPVWNAYVEVSTT